MVERNKCDRCAATDLLALEILDPVTSHVFVVCKCNACNHLHWADSDLRRERASVEHKIVDGKLSSTMGHIDTCLDRLRDLIRAGNTNDLNMAEDAVEQYWAATPVRARKSGLLYIQQILHGEFSAADPNNREFAAFVDAYIEKKLTT
jgi:hypothetical protein